MFSADLTEVQHTEYRADLIVRLCDEKPVYAIIVEVQLQVKERKRFVWLTLQTLPASPPSEQNNALAQACGFSLHAGIATEADARGKLERLCRYVSRPAVAEQRLALTPRGEVLLKLKTPYRDGTTHLRLQPLDFLARLAALVPPPRSHLTRYHGYSPLTTHCAPPSPRQPGGAAPARNPTPVPSPGTCACAGCNASNASSPSTSSAVVAAAAPSG